MCDPKENITQGKSKNSKKQEVSLPYNIKICS